ncbi:MULTISPECIES: hypothetical protein [unclassified Curtobacterium]|uniref:hypothetical protein n=1 Tax=unclassified Curtobacterium TaxID=257496 RepID=UPI002780C595|nr:hypothetical protein [Curtobacterium sp. 260]MDP9737691.1 ElaB/YqjD/DUF883 family membrane-anchored ribosome-binding protein [Curtobacterium sp. 260]
MMLTRAGGTGNRQGSRIAGVVAVTGALALVLAGCTADQDQVTDPSRVLQTVDTTLTTNGAVNAISDTTISVAGTRSSSKTVDHDVQDAAGDLPLRITTQYTTDKRSGTDLADLDGYSGRVEIDVTVENLTVRSQNLSYDVAGASRSTPALVGAPFSVAASTVLDGVAPDRIVTESVDGGASTDGVVSTNASGDAVVQWGRLLAPPTSGASSTLHLVADVRDFSTPAIDVAAQPGLTTDLSTSGVMNGAFGSETDSELALQRRTIDLIAQVNEVLARAGGTITEVRTNLESTSETLGVRTAERLQESSASLASTMQSLSGELGSLNGDLGSTVQATQSTVLQQLQQTTGSLDALLGDTSATAPKAVLDGEGCNAVPQTGAAGSSVYGNLLRVSAQLEGYADASEACKQQVSAQLATSVGPTSPDATACAAEEARGSLTCALWESSAAVNTSLIGLVSKGQQLADGLDPDLAKKAIEQSDDLNGDLQQISEALQDIASDEDGTVGEKLRALDALVTTTNASVRPVQEAVTSVHRRAVAARAEVGDLDDSGLFGKSTLQAQNRALADRLCQLARPGVLSPGDLDQDQVDTLRGYLTAEPCPGTDQPEGTTLRPGFGFSTPMDERLDEQAAAWDDVVTGTDLSAASGVGPAVRDLAAAVDSLEPGVRDLREAIRDDSGSVDQSVTDLQALLDPAIESGAVVNDQLQQVRDQQAELQDAVREAFQQASDDSGKQVQALIDEQVRKVSDTAGTSREAVVDAFDKSIAGLRTTSGEVTSDSKGTIDEQKGSLQEQSSSLASSVDEQTAASLQRIDASTSASVRDVEGASTLLTGDLNRVMLDLGDREVNGSGILGAMATSAAKSDSADYQLALASQNASGYANVRAEDVAGILLQQQQFRASLDRAAKLPAFRLDVPSSATSTTLYAFRIGAER